MLNQIVRLFTSSVESLGNWAYLIIFLGPFLESSAFLGLIIPGETIMVLAGFMSSHGDLDVRTCLWVSALGAVLGDSISYALGSLLERNYFERHDRLYFIKRQHIEKVDGYLQEHGGKTIFFARFISFLRALAPFVAGLSRMRYGTFFKYNAVGGVIWAVAFIFFGYFFGQYWSVINKWVERVWIAAIIVLAVGGAIYYFKTRKQKRRELFVWIMDHYKAINAAPPVSALRRRYEEFVSYLETVLSPGSYLTLYLAAGFAAAIAFIWIFGLLFTGEPFTSTDVWMHNRMIPRFRSSTMDRVMGAFAGFDGLAAVIIGSLLLMLLLLIKNRFAHLVGYLLAISGGGALVLILNLKSAAGGPGTTQPGPGSTIAVIFYGMIIYLTIRDLRSWKIRLSLVLLAVILVLCIGFSEIYRSADPLGGILAGYAEGLLWLVLCITGLDIYGRKKESDQGPRP